jgi:hypothetical protein
VAGLKVHAPGAVVGEDDGLLRLGLQQMAGHKGKPTGQLGCVLVGEVSEGSGVQRR